LTHPIEEVGKNLRANMSWIGDKNKKIERELASAGKAKQ
jgi:hypothetical protein